MIEFLQVTVSGLTTGVLYGMFAMGFVVVFNSTRVINFAQGEFAVLAGLAAGWLARTFPLAPALIAGLAVGGATGTAVFEVGLRPLLRRATLLRQILAVLACSLVLQAAAPLVFGVDPIRLPSPVEGIAVLDIGGVRVPPHTLLIVFFGGAIAVSLDYFYTRTRWGRAITAASIDPEAASALGIRVRHIARLSFVLAGLLGGVVGVLISPVTGVVFNQGLVMTVKGFAAAILGGMGRVYGSLIGGLILGLSEAYAIAFLSTAYRHAIAMGILIVVLVVAPRGLLKGGR